MSMNFAKNARAVAFNPTSAFPLDARSYFESYEAAQAAATTAVEVGSSDGIYYIGQTLTVVENNVATFYIINPDKTLGTISNDDGPVKVLINENYFEYTEDNKLQLKVSGEGKKDQVLAMSADGGLAWVTPVDAYTKTETDKVINTAVANAAHLKRKIVDSVAGIEAIKDYDDADQYIYMVPKTDSVDSDHYDEYLIVEVAEVKFVEKVGDWKVDLSDYATKQHVSDNYVAKNGTDRLVTEAEVEKWNAGEANVISSASTTDFAIDDNKQLSLNDIAMSKVTGLIDALKKKIDVQEGYTLLSPTDQEKLGQLTIGDSGNLEVSGSVNADNVKELDAWITKKRNDVEGLFNSDAEAKLAALFDRTSNEFTIASVGDEENGYVKELQIVAISKDKITGLTEDLEALSQQGATSADKVTELTKTTEELTKKLENYVTTEKLTEYATVERVEALEEALTWTMIE